MAIYSKTALTLNCSTDGCDSLTNCLEKLSLSNEEGFFLAS